MLIFVKQGHLCMNSPQRVAGELHGELEDSGLMNNYFSDKQVG
jgi:hypothetical protein